MCYSMGFPCGSAEESACSAGDLGSVPGLGWAYHVLVVKNPPANAGDAREVGLISGSGRAPGGEHGNPLQYPRLENPADKGAWWATGHSVAKSRT